ncbi:LOW QUALITY PROTEIN: solute carrier family 25 member 43 [Thamnophis elegans]|uniref:LOW QUALITY PROTEIN: solute carrier family 25 member 43 n=1 Tax=Thamnophis elegans TaxID=35005 RepID=UPI001378D4AB|nr:LOW QUALITY PROTEIN: solute carrier family 25 member 43 [Thamnophis elegans]
MATWKRDGRLTALQRLGCAGLAGAASHSLTAPLEVLTVLGQVGALPGRRSGLWRAGRSLWQAEGPGALWKGNLTACLRLLPYSAVQLASYRRCVMWLIDDLGHISQWNAIVAGSLAGMMAAIATYPTEVVKTRLIAQKRLDPPYKGILHALYMIYHQEGASALYRRVSCHIRCNPISVGSFLVYTHLDELWGQPNLPFTPMQNFFNGCLAAAVAQTFSFPFETVKRKIQAQSSHLPCSGGVDVHFSGVIDCFKQTVKTKGVLALWNGLTANLLRIVPYFGIMFSTFEFCKRVCLYWNGYTDSPLRYALTPGVDQSLRPQELQDVKLLGRRNF